MPPEDSASAASASIDIVIILQGDREKARQTKDCAPGGVRQPTRRIEK